MPCPHGANGTPERCSQCIGARARAVRSDEGGVTIDGAKVRGSLLETGLIAQPVTERRAKRRKHRPRAMAAPQAVAASSEVEGSATPVEPEVIAESAPDPATDLGFCYRPRILLPPPEATPAHAEPTVPVRPAAPRVARAARDKRPAPGRPVVTAAQLKAAHSIVDYAETHAALAFPTPAGCEAIALLDCALDLAGSDVEIAELHRLGLISLVALGNAPGLERSLHLRGHRRPDGDDIIMVDGVAHDGVRVIATPTPIESALDVAELVWMHAERPFADFLDHVWTVAKGSDEKAAGAKALLCREWDRIRGVLPALSQAEAAPTPDAPPELMRVAPILRDACAVIEQPPQSVGRPRLPIRDVLFAVVVAAGTGATIRGVARDLPALKAAGYVSTPMHYNVLSRALCDPVIVGALARLAEETERRVGAPVPLPIEAPRPRVKSEEAGAAATLAMTVWRNLAHLAQAVPP